MLKLSRTDEPEDDTVELHTACTEGSLEEIKNFFNEDREIDDFYHDGLTPLHVAILSGRTDVEEVIDVLVNNGVDVNAPTKFDDSSALHLLIENGEFPHAFHIVLKLLEHDANINLRNRGLRTPYDCALAKGYDVLAATLQGAKTPEEAREYFKEKTALKYAPYLTQAVLESDEAAIKKNLKMGASPNFLNQHGAGAIHYAITHCTLPVLDILEMLKNGGADVNLRDDEGDTALNLAIKSEQLRSNGQMAKVVTKLKSWGADHTIQDLDGKDALDMASERNYNDIVAILKNTRPGQLRNSEEEDDKLVVKALEDSRKKKDDINKPNEDGLYPIHLAVLKEDPSERNDEIETLLEAGAQINVANREDGDTALHMAAERDYADTAKQLLDHNIDINKKNKLGKTAYDVAKEHNSSDVMALLEEIRKKKAVQEKWKKGAKKASSCNIL